MFSRVAMGLIVYRDIEKTSELSSRIDSFLGGICYHCDIIHAYICTITKYNKCVKILL